jgi:hypothetical protein
MTALIDKLKTFHGGNLEELNIQFKELAPYFLYGGFYDVNNHYRIYIRSVEFYFHSEKDSEDSVKDPIVYHRNNKYVEGDVPYFNPLSLHAHTSGFDITFENEKEKYRASALIRAYEVYDTEKKCFLVYDTQKMKFVSWIEKMRIMKKVIKKYNEQSTYLYNFLNGFCTGSIRWIPLQMPQSTITLTIKKRKNVYKSKDSNIYVPLKELDEREWSFTRNEDIKI